MRDSCLVTGIIIVSARCLSSWQTLNVVLRFVGKFSQFCLRQFRVCCCGAGLKLGTEQIPVTISKQRVMLDICYCLDGWGATGSTHRNRRIIYVVRNPDCRNTFPYLFLVRERTCSHYRLVETFHIFSVFQQNVHAIWTFAYEFFDTEST